MGIEHVLLPDEGCRSGDLVIGADSHTCTYGALCAFSTGVGSTDLASGDVLGECGSRSPRRCGSSFRPPREMGRGEGRDPSHHRRDRGGRGALPGDGIRGTGSRTCRWRGASPWRTWRSRRGRKTDLPVRRGDEGVRRRKGEAEGRGRDGRSRRAVRRRDQYRLDRARAGGRLPPPSGEHEPLSQVGKRSRSTRSWWGRAPTGGSRTCAARRR